MAFYATRRYSHLGQLGMLFACSGVGLIVGGLLSLLPLVSDLMAAFNSKGGAADLMKSLMKPENAGALRWSQFISTLFLFFLPAVIYAAICHKKPFIHLGFAQPYRPVKPAFSTLVFQFLLVVIIMMASLPAVSALQELTSMLPWPKAALQHFKEAEDEYNKLVAVIARMDNIGDYLISVVVIALLPAVFEETLFRGGLQNLLSRWIKMPVLAILITSIIFSAVHGSYLGFLSRVGLGFVLGWFYYKTGNLWLNMVGHFVNNAVAITALYVSTKKGEIVDPSKIDDRFPLWIGLLSLAAVVGLFILFDKLSKSTEYKPGEEVPIPGVADSNNPFERYIPQPGNEPQNQ